MDHETGTAPADASRGGGNAYLRFGGMIVSSAAVMFLLTYANVFDVAHIHFSQERFYMAVLMGSAMAIVMLAWMWKMYPDRRLNLAIIGGSVVLGIAAFVCSQTQAAVYDVNYMRGMIPHHSIAILTSERAGLSDARVRELADGIIEAQRREIAEMEWLIRDIEQNGTATTETEAAARPVPSFEAAPLVGWSDCNVVASGCGTGLTRAVNPIRGWRRLTTQPPGPCRSAAPS